MTKTQYHSSTVDGFIAEDANSLGWLFEVESRADRFTPLFAQVGAIPMGATTYEWVLGHERLREHPEKWQEFYGDVRSWVFTHRRLPSVRARLRPSCPVT